MKKICLLLSSLLFPIFNFAGEWGVGAGGFSVPHYMGSAEHYEFQLVLPIYMEDGNIFQEKEGLYFDMEANFNLPVESDSSSATTPSDYNNTDKFIAQNKNFSRRGMNDLAAAFYLGPKVGFRFGPVEIEASATPGVFLGKGWGNAGLITTTSLKLHLLVDNSAKSASCLCLYYDIKNTNDTYNSAYYGVDAADAISGRSQYDASKSGLLGTEAGIYYVKRIDSLILMGMMNFQSMENSVVEDSPLVKRKNGSAVAFGLGYYF